MKIKGIPREIEGVRGEFNSATYEDFFSYTCVQTKRVGNWLKIGCRVSRRIRLEGFFVCLGFGWVTLGQESVIFRWGWDHRYRIDGRQGLYA